MKAVGYIRVSTEEQAREGYGLSAQEQAVRSFCEAHGWDLTEIYSDAGRSGSSINKREALSRLLAGAEAGAFERVIFMKGAQVGGSEAGHNWLGSIMHETPAPTMVVLPTVDLGKKWSKQRLDPMIQDSPALAARSGRQRKPRRGLRHRARAWTQDARAGHHHRLRPRRRRHRRSRRHRDR